MERATDVFEPLDLGFGSCRLAVAALQPERGSAKTSPLRKPQARAGDVPSGRHATRLRGATKYPNMTERYFTQKGIPIQIIKLYGSVGLAPLGGLADLLVDLGLTGETLSGHNPVGTDVI